MCIITQSVHEIISSKIGPAVLANAATQIILNHTDASEILHLAGHLGFTDHEVELIRSIRRNDVEGYRELFIKQGDFAKVYLMEVAPAVDAILTSKPEERDYLRKLQGRYKGNISFAISQYVESKKSKRTHEQSLSTNGSLTGLATAPQNILHHE
jgi:type IV secretory pathway VirB4 component